MNRKVFSVAVFLISLVCVISAGAQTRHNATASASQRINAEQEPARKEASQVSIESADVAITATVTARELTFEAVPNPVVEFPGKPQRDTIWEADRDNLPRPVEPGVTYRNIGIRLRIVSRFKDIDRIVAEALGEVPLTDDVPPPDTVTPPPGSTTEAPKLAPIGGSPR